MLVDWKNGISQQRRALDKTDDRCNKTSIGASFIGYEEQYAFPNSRTTQTRTKSTQNKYSNRRVNGKEKKRPNRRTIVSTANQLISKPEMKSNQNVSVAEGQDIGGQNLLTPTQTQ